MSRRIAEPLAVLLAIAVVVAAAYFLFTPKPSVAKLKAQGATLVDAVERYRAAHGEYPATLEAAGVSAPWTGYGRWEYGRDVGGGFYLRVGNYSDHLFLMGWDSREKRWYIDS